MSLPGKMLKIEQGAAVFFRQKPHHITHVVDLNEVLIIDDETQKILQVKISELTTIPADGPAKVKQDLVLVEDKSWGVATQRFNIIKPLLGKSGRKRQDVIDRAKEFKLHENTIYGWIRDYENSLLLSALLPKSRSDKGEKRLPEEVEVIMKNTIETQYLSKQRKSKQKACLEIHKLCKNAGITPPHKNTIYNRIKELDAEFVMSKRHGKKQANQVYSPIEGSFPDANWPYAVIQIDHTKIDIILVDDLHRKPVGRPWITLAIDVFSRMVAGFYVSFDPPGAMSTGQCVTNTILPKDAWLAKHNIHGEWHCWGIPDMLHMDNAKEFRGTMLKRACQEYGIDIEWRPVARPHFGAHIERLMETFGTEIHELPGTTFSNTQQRGDYDSEGNAAITLAEFEEWLVTFIVNVYHKRFHSGINMAPIEKYRQGIFGSSESPGRGLPSRMVDEERLRLDLMPYKERTIQDYGVLIDKVHYYHDVVRHWINAPDPQKPKDKRKFMFRRNPMDISVIWFFDPELHCYYQLPYRDTSLPPISIWELRQATRLAEANGRKNIDERAIFEAYDRMREIEDQAKAKTSAVRRAAQRRKSSQESVKASPISQQAPPVTVQIEVPVILPFEEMDDLT